MTLISCSHRYEYLLLDVLVFFAAVIFIIGYIARAVFRYYYYLVQSEYIYEEFCYKPNWLFLQVHLCCCYKRTLYKCKKEAGMSFTQKFKH